MRKTIHSPEYRQLIEGLKAARKNAGVTQSELSERLGRPQSFVAKYESRERRLDVLELIQITEALRVDVLPLVRQVRSSLRAAKPK